MVDLHSHTLVYLGVGVEFIPDLLLYLSTVEGLHLLSQHIIEVVEDHKWAKVKQVYSLLVGLPIIEKDDSRILPWNCRNLLIVVEIPKLFIKDD